MLSAHVLVSLSFQRTPPTELLPSDLFVGLFDISSAEKHLQNDHTENALSVNAF